MGIINVTPDSFSDGGVLLDAERAIEAGVQMVQDGADLLDVGGESTRPGAEPLGEAEERRRIVPVIEGLLGRVQVPISVDTYKATIADAAVEAGASIVNDVSGLRYEPDLAVVVARRQVPIVLMHTRGRSRDMYREAVYHDVIDEVLDELRESMAFATGAGYLQGSHRRRSGSRVREGAGAHLRSARTPSRVQRARSAAARGAVSQDVPHASDRT